jgi:hypothetical protein
MAGDTGVIAGNYNAVGSVYTPVGNRYSWVKGTAYVQSFVAKEGGFPTELIVNMGVDCSKIMNIDQQGTGVSNNTIYSHLTIDAPAGRIFDQDLPGVKQNGLESGCEVKFPISGAIGAVQKGQQVKMTLLISSIKRFDQKMGVYYDDGSAQYVAILQDNADWPRTTYNGNVTALRFQVKTTPITMTATAPVGGSILWEDGTTCGTQCSQAQNSGAQHAFTAQPAAGYAFMTWSNPCMGQPATCSTSPTVGMPLSATFGVTLTITPSTNGTVTCTRGCNLKCGYGGTICSGLIPIGTAVTLSTSPKAGMNWQGWSGACSGITRGCALTMDSAKAVTGHFGAGVAF